jgi:hypothetical protein
MSITRSTPMRPEQLELQVEAIDAMAIKLIPDTMPGALGFRAVIVNAIREYLDTLPLGNFPPNFKPGERVEYVPMRGEEPRPGTVVEIDFEPVLMAHMRVRFDDGEERQINPDVMRRIKNQES